MTFSIEIPFVVEDGYFDEMIEQVNDGASFEEAYDEIISGFDDCNYYIAYYVRDDIIAELKRRYNLSQIAEVEENEND